MCTHKRWADDPGQPTGAVPSTRSPVPAPWTVHQDGLSRAGQDGVTQVQAGRAVFRQAQAGCRDCLNELMEQHDGLVHAVVRKQILGDLPYDEAIQAGRIGLWRAVPSADSGHAWAMTRAEVLFPPMPGRASRVTSGGPSKKWGDFSSRRWS